MTAGALRWLSIVALSLFLPLPCAAFEPGMSPKCKRKAEILRQAIHGKHEARLGFIVVRYDFKDSNQAKDFRLDSRIDAATLPQGVQVYFPPRGPLVEHEELRLDHLSVTRLDLPVSAIGSVACEVVGLDDLSIRFSNDDAPAEVESTLNVQLGPINHINLGDEEITPVSFRGFGRNFMRASRYHRIEVWIRKKEVYVTIDGNNLLRMDLPRDFPAPNRVAFSTHTIGNPAFEELIVQGRVEDDDVAKFANRGRALAKKPPLWENAASAISEGFRVTSPRSVEHAKHWLARLDGVAGHLRDRIGGENVKRPPVEVFVFTDRREFEAYSGKRTSHHLAWGPVVIFDDGAAESEVAASPNFGAAMTAAMRGWIDRDTPGAPDWWRLGVPAYAAGVAWDDHLLVSGRPRPRLIALLKDLPESIIVPEIRRLLDGGKIEGAEGLAVAWAWIHFLAEADGGYRTSHLAKFRRESSAGSEPGTARRLAFPNDLTPQLLGDFQAYLRSL